MQTESQKAWYLRNRERLIKKQAEKDKADPEQARKNGRNYYKRKKQREPDYFRLKARREYANDPEHHRRQAKSYRAKVRKEMIIAYGGACSCCGETVEVFLTLEHKNRDGRAHRKSVGNTSTQVYADLKKRGWPKEDYELLCFNCNRASWELGICPHRTSKEVI